MVLFIVSAGVEASGAIEYLKRFLFFRYKKGESLPLTLLRISIVLGIASAFLNNTPLVAIFIPVLDDFCKDNGLVPSKIMMPLSYSVILGGTLTLMGTSTNLVAIGLAEATIPGFSMGLFDMARIGLPVFIAGSLYIAVFTDVLLPERVKSSTLDVLDDPREFVVSVMVQEDSVIVGRTIEQADLRSLPGLFIVDIIRGEQSIPAPAPNTVICAGDQIVLAGDVDTVVAITRTRGLALVEDPQHHDLRKLRGDRLLVEAVVGNHTSLVGKTVRELDFRAHYEAAIIAVHRGGERVNQRIGDIVLRPGDALLLVTGPRFVNTFGGGSSVFVLVRLLSTYTAPTAFNYRALISAVTILTIIVVSAAASVSLCLLGFFAVAVMMFCKIVDADKARKAINLEVLIMIAAGFALSAALTNSGAAELIANGLIDATINAGNVALLTMFYIVAVVFNAVVTNNAAVAIMFPIALNIYNAGVLHIDTLIFVLMFAGSADFCTPIGYQTNLMVMAPGGYKFLDYTKFGFPLQVICGVFCIFVALNIDQWWVITLIIVAATVVLVGGTLLWKRFFILSPWGMLCEKVSFLHRFAPSKRSLPLESQAFDISMLDMDELPSSSEKGEKGEKGDPEEITRVASPDVPLQVVV